MHHTPTYASWLNQVERWFALLTDKKLRRGTYRSIQALEKDIRDWIAAWNEHPQPFTWTKTAASLKLDGTEVFDITGIGALNEGKTPTTVHVKATKENGSAVEFDAVVRIDTPGEADYYRNGGILQYVLRNMLKSA